ncbi:MAG TPA: cytochrome P450 [Sphingobium sp.]|nr:cytochrome P450 [Sphingobium sp.]
MVPTYRTEPGADEAVDAWLAAQGQEDGGVVSNPDDTSRAELYSQATWEPLFARMRATAPLNRVEGTACGDYWNVCSHALLTDVEGKPELFSSSWKYGGIALADPAPGEEFQLPMFIAMDEPEHGAQRKTVAPAFTPAHITELAVKLRAHTGAVLDSLPVGSRFDWVEKVSIELATSMLATILGFPWEDRHLLTFWSDWAGNMEAARIPELFQVRREVLTEMATYFHLLWEERRARPDGTDLLGMMIRSDTMSEMGPMEFIGNLALLIVGGNDTTRSSMSAIAVGLDQFPEERAKLEADESLIPNAVQEIIRWHTPIAHMRRTATVDCELAGQKIAAGDKLALWYISANRDESVFPDAARLDLSRANARRHLSFGHGIHRCVGARLAELQLRILIEELRKRRLQVHVAGEVRRVHANFVNGFRHIEVEMTRA